MQGKTINGYTLQQQLGMGGMAEVWYAENAIGKKAAVKLLLTKFCNDESIVARFENEAKVMVPLDHPNIRQVYDYGSLDGRPGIVMEYLEGDDLKALMKSGRRFTDAELRKWWNQIADALNYTHAKGIVHRDIKPSNIFLDKKGNIKLLDFGIAKIKESISMTQTGATMGTLMYMSPEQVDDAKHLGPESDVYSLAVSFVHLLTGKTPYDSTTSSDFKIRESIVYKPLDLSGVPADWQGFLAPYLEKDPEKRPALRPFETAASKTPIQPTESDDEGTIVNDAPKKQEPKMPEPKPTTKSKPNDNKSKKGLWIGLGAAAAVALLLVLLLRPKGTVESQAELLQQPSEEPLSTPSEMSNSSLAFQDVPNGAVNGLFSVGVSKQVFFSKGNLQYQASTDKWRFAESQWEYVGTYNSNISSTYSGWIDLFSWGTGINPTLHSKNSLDYTSFNDWGVCGMRDGWRTPTADEWNYLFKGRPNAEAKYGAATVNGVAGMVLLPDDWTLPSGLSFNPNQLGYSSNVYDIASWRKMEEDGAVFFPTSGRRDGTQLFKQGTDGDYWSSTPHSNGRAYNVDFMNGSLTPKDNSPTKQAFAVRLIKDR